jgi:uncharacterized integral membrane protein
VPFYINKAGIPGRIFLPVSLFLILFAMLNNINKDIPRLKYSTWIIDYIFGIFVFLTAVVAEFGVLNY